MQVCQILCDCPFLPGFSFWTCQIVYSSKYLPTCQPRNGREARHAHVEALSNFPFLSSGCAQATSVDYVAWSDEQSQVECF